MGGKATIQDAGHSTRETVVVKLIDLWLRKSRAVDALVGGILAGIGVLGLACGGNELLLPDDGRPAALAVVDGDHQSAQVGAPLPQPLVVRVSDATGRPVAGAQVTFAVTSGSGGELSPAVASTD